MKCPLCKEYYVHPDTLFKRLYMKNDHIKVCPKCWDKEMLEREVNKNVKKSY